MTTEKNEENSLLVQWLGLQASTAEGRGLIPGQGTRILQVAWPKKTKTTHTHTHTQKRMKNGYETDFIKAEGRYANTGQSQGTATRGLMQGPRALGWVGGEPSTAGEAMGPSLGFQRRGGGLLGCSGWCPSPFRTESLEYF